MSGIGNPARTGRDGPLKNAILIAGPTASGKSARALTLARETLGTVVNADSMQVYAMLTILSARPDEADMAIAPHRLYGHVHPREAYSTGRWMRDVEALIDAGALDQGPAIFVGGTGLYFRALLEGLSEMPHVPDTVRANWRGRLESDGAPALHGVLRERDPEAALAIKPGDGQRIVRALEVLEASGRRISEWQRDAGKPLVDRETARCIVLEPDRQVLRERIDRRFDTMIDRGAMEEARAIGALQLDEALPAMKAIGLRELIAADRGEMTVDAAIARAKITTRQYAKRQSTWFRNQLDERWERLPAEQR